LEAPLNRDGAVSKDDAQRAYEKFETPKKERFNPFESNKIKR
jgi:hypothetical protein